MSLKFAERLNLKITPVSDSQSRYLSAADGHSLDTVGTIDVTLTTKGLKISPTFKVVRNLAYNLILGLDFMNHTQVYLNFGDNTLSICDNLVVTDLFTNQKPMNVLRATSNCIIPPLSEAIIPVHSTAPESGQYLLEPMPNLSKQRVSLARAVVCIDNHQTLCRLINPTNASVSLKKRIPLATATPIPKADVFDYTKSTSEPTKPTVGYETQLKELQSLGLEIDAQQYTQHQREQLISMLHNNRDLFTCDLRNIPGTDLVKHTIDTGDAAPIRQRPYRHTPESKKEIDRQLDLMLEADIIEESDSPWGSPVVLVRKKNNTHRLCVDMRKLNSVTKPVFFPLPLLEDVFQTVAENKASIFSVIDMTSGFWQIKLDDSSKPKTGFVTHRGNYQFKRMPFGIQGAPASYQALMHKVLRGILFIHSLCYLDDVICMSDCPESHLEHLSEILDRFRQAKLRLNPTKCKVALSKVVYLGHVLSKDGISVDNSKVDVIKTFPVPQNTQQLRSFLGIANYYRRFIKHFSIKTANLRSLLKRDAAFVWNTVHQQEFDFLKQTLTSAPILAFPNMQKDYILTTDACTSGIAYILSQLDDNGLEHVMLRRPRSSQI